MLGDESTLPEALRDSLVRAGFADDVASARLIQENLAAPAPRARILALRAAARRDLLDAAAWIAAMGDPSPIVRRESLTLVAHERLVDDDVRAVLVAALDDSDDLCVDAAAFAIGEHLVAGALDALMEVAARHRDARCREAAVAALGALGDDRARATVIAALDDKAPVRRRAVVALANFDGPEVDAALARARDDRDWQVRAAADQLNDDD